MTYRRAVIPALVGSLLVTLLLWWAGESAQALQLRGATSVFDAQSVSELRLWLAPWSYDPPSALLAEGSMDTATGGGAAFGGSSHYADLYTTAMQIRFVAVFAFFLAGALILIRRIPPTQGRTPATVLGLWAWTPMAGMLAVTVSAPWLIASYGHGSFRLLPRLASVIVSSGPVTVLAGLVTALVTVLVARVTAKGDEPSPRQSVPPRAARLAASAGTAVIALSLVVLSYQSVAAWIQTSFDGAGLLSEPGELLRAWLLLGSWTSPASTPIGDWLLYRAADALVLVAIWWALRLLPGLLTRTTAPAMALGGVCATVLALWAGRVVHIAFDSAFVVRGPVSLITQLDAGAPAALTFGIAAGLTALVTLRLAGSRDVGKAPASTADSGEPVADTTRTEE
uniref:Integral membrane protein n=1 Tax=Streptomyces sp. NBC_01393 TaxID=2903851 RepID=A0AAU3I7D8_9ACTN